jgi:hypothetical protein
MPLLEIGEKEGFQPDKDIFRRKEFGVRLANLLVNTSEPITLGLDARWGEGKSTFVRMWQGCLKSKELDIVCVCFDAFESDYQQDAFLTISREIYQIVDKADAKAQKEYRKLAAGALKVVAKIGTRIAIKAATAGVLDESILASESGEISDTINEVGDDYLESQIAALESDEKKIQEFKNFLGKLPKLINTEKPIIIVIDELDRCRPDYAIEIIECVKHFFSIPNIHFILVMNRKHLESAISHRYGVDQQQTTEYLQKFVKIWATLPTINNQGESPNRTIYLRECLDKMDLDYATYESQINEYAALLDLFKMSFREIEQSLTYFSIIENSGLRTKNFGNTWISIYLPALKIKFPDLYRGLLDRSIGYSDLAQKSGIATLKYPGWEKAGFTPSHPLTWSLKLCFSNSVEPFDEQAHKVGLNIDLYASKNSLNELLTVLEEYIYIS